MDVLEVLQVKQKFRFNKTPAHPSKGTQQPLENIFVIGISNQKP